MLLSSVGEECGACGRAEECRKGDWDVGVNARKMKGR